MKELAASIQREGLIAPIVVRPIDKRYQLIAGERRLRAVRDYTGIKAIAAQIIFQDRIYRIMRIFFALSCLPALGVNERAKIPSVLRTETGPLVTHQQR